MSLTINWDAVAAVSGIVSSVAAIVSAAGIWFAWRAVSYSSRTLEQQIRSQDFSTLRQFTLDIREAVGNLSNSSDIDFEVAIVEYLNLLETYAAGVNRSLIEKSTRVVAQEQLINDLAIMLERPDVSRQIALAIESRITFTELRKFRDKHLAVINRAREKERERLGPQVSSE